MPENHHTVLSQADFSGLAPYASHPEKSRGRVYDEPEDPYRSCFQRDRDRIIHSTAFRRLEYKTQVFVNHEGDHYRTRLTHSLEVAQIARSLARALNLNEDLAEALALAHDLGHPPFGHAGEAGLNEAMREFGGFDHNIHTLKIVTKLEHRYAEFDGLNLTLETLDGLIKHNGPPATHKEQAIAQKYTPFLPSSLSLHTYASMEAQVAALADDIAYHNHDIDDGLRAGLFTVDDMQAVPDVYAVFEEVSTRYPGITLQRLTHETCRRLIHRMCLDVITETEGRISSLAVATPEEVGNAGKPMVSFSSDMQQLNAHLKAFLMERMYRHYRVNRMYYKAKKVVSGLFDFFLNQPDCLPTVWRDAAKGQDTHKQAEIVSDYIAGMTDRYALRLYDEVLG